MYYCVRTISLVHILIECNNICTRIQEQQTLRWYNNNNNTFRSFCSQIHFNHIGKLLLLHLLHIPT